MLSSECLAYLPQLLPNPLLQGERLRQRGREKERLKYICGNSYGQVNTASAIVWFPDYQVGLSSVYFQDIYPMQHCRGFHRNSRKCSGSNQLAFLRGPFLSQSLISLTDACVTYVFCSLDVAAKLWERGRECHFSIVLTSFSTTASVQVPSMWGSQIP